MGGLNPAGGHSCMELLARASHTSYLLQYLCTPIPLAIWTQTCDPISLGSSPPSDIYSPLHIRPPQCLLAAADAKPSWRGGRSHWWEKLGICSICSVQYQAIYLSRLRSPLLSGAVLPDPDLELAEATVEQTSISKRHEHEERYNHETVIVCLLVEAWT